MYLFDINMFITPWRRNKADRKVLDTTTRLWTNFAKYGNPNGDPQLAKRDFDFNWEPTEVDQPEKHLVIQKDSYMKQQLDTRRVERLTPMFEYFLP